MRSLYYLDMKSDIHPTVNPVVFVDTSCNARFVTTSTLTSANTEQIDGVDHFVINIEVSSASHPFFTGQDRFVDTAGRVDKFKEKMAKSENLSGTRTKKEKREARKVKKEAGTK